MKAFSELAVTILFAALLSVIFPQSSFSDITDPDNSLYPALGMPAWSNNQGWDQEMYWGTILTGDLDGDGIDELVGCGADGLEIWAYDAATGVWSMRDLLKELASDAGGVLYSQASFYNSLVLADIDGDGAKEILGRDVDSPNLMFTYDYNSQAASQSDKWGLGPDWTLVSGWDWEKPWCHETVMSAKLTSGDDREAIVVYTTGGLQAAFYNADAANGQNWSFSEKDSQTALENVMDGAAEPSADFYQSLQAVQMDLTGVGDSDIDEIIYVAPDGGDAYVRMRRYLDGGWASGRMDQGPWRGNEVFWNLMYATENRDDNKSLLQFEYGDTLRVADINGDGLKEVLFLSSEGLVAYSFDEHTKCSDGSWAGWKHGYEVYGTWADFKSWAPLYQNSLRFVDIDNDGKEEIYNLTTGGAFFWSLEKGGISTATTVGRNFSTANGWAATDEYHYADAIFFPTLSADGSKSMLARGASGMRTYEYTAAGDATYHLPHLIDAAKGNFVTFTGQSEVAYQAILEYFWQEVPSMKGVDLRATYTVNLDNRQWGVDFPSLDGLARPAGVSESAWAAVKQQIKAEVDGVSRIYKLYSSYVDHLVELKGLCEDALDSAYTLVDYSGKKTDKSDFWVGLVAQTCANLGFDLVGAIPGLEELWLLKTALPFAKDLFGAGFSALFNGTDVSGSDAAVELAYGDFKNDMGDWYASNQTQITTQLVDVLTSWGKFRHVDEFAQGIEQAEANDQSWQWVQQLKDLAAEQAAAYKDGIYKYLVPMDYEIWWYHDKNKPWWLFTYLSGPPDYSYYYDSSQKQHWALVYKHKHEAYIYAKHAPKELLEAILHGNLSDSDQEKQDLFLGNNGWDIDVQRMVNE